MLEVFLKKVDNNTEFSFVRNTILKKKTQNKC